MSDSQLESLRSAGAWRLDPVRLRYLEALSRRLHGQPEPVRRLLQDKLRTALSDFAQRLAQAGPVDADAVAAPCAQPRSPLAQLNEQLRRDPQQQDELASARRFKRAWSGARTQERVEQATSRRPLNAGPLNSHVLVLESLALMGQLSPDYLHRFMAHAETLQWLEQAGTKSRPPQGKANRPSKTGSSRPPVTSRRRTPG